MSKRSDVLKVLEGKEPEFVPWFADLAYWLNYLRDEQKIPKEYLAMGSNYTRNLVDGLAGGLAEEGLQQLHKDLGAGFYLQGYFPFQEIYHNASVEITKNKNDTITYYKTPYGTLREVWRYVESSHSSAPVEYLVKSSKDLKALQYLYQDIEYVPDYALSEMWMKSIGENGINVSYTPKSPMMELVALKAGIETVITELLQEEPNEFDELMKCMAEKHTQAAQIAIDSPAGCIFVPDNLSSELVGGNIYDEYIKPIHEDWTERIRKAGKKSMVHLDGTLIPLLTKLSYAGFDVIEAVTPYPVGDIKLEELRKHVKEETIIWGGLPSGFFADSFSDTDFEEWVKKVLDLMRKDNRFVLGVADEVVPGTTFERIRTVDRLVTEFGKFESR